MAKKIEKASLLKRISAYIIDYLLIIGVITLLSIPFVDYEKMDKLQKEEKQINEKFQKAEISDQEYLDKNIDIYYQLNISGGVKLFITIIVQIIYYIIYQLYNKGQTIGKKIMNIRVISENGDLTMNQMIFRTFICNMLLLNILNFALMIFNDKFTYTTISVSITLIQYIIVLISVIMATNNNGYTVHDRITHTRVIKVK